MSKSKMGRPRMEKGEKRIYAFNIRVNEKEKKLLEDTALLHGYSNPTVWGRETLLSIAEDTDEKK